jgi:hypothetical protein
MDAVNKSNLTATQAVQIMLRLLPICVTMDNMYLEGSFAFSDLEMEEGETSGFCSAEGGDDGGSFGILYGSDEEADLPIY